jgi:hypothetical protein
MYKSSLVGLVLFGCSVVLAYGASIATFQATYDDTNVRIEWEVNSEGGVQEYALYRKANNEPSFTKLASLEPNRQRAYHFIDQNSYHGLNGGPFTYHLVVLTSSGQQSFYTVLNQMPSAVERSWGTIKSMFK